MVVEVEVLDSLVLSLRAVLVAEALQILMALVLLELQIQVVAVVGDILFLALLTITEQRVVQV
jgi:hypothetical protein